MPTNNRFTLSPTLGVPFVENGEIKVLAEVRVTKGNAVQTGTQVVFQEGMNPPPTTAAVSTDHTGIARYTYIFPAAYSNQAVTLRMYLFSHGDEVERIITLPDAGTATTSKKKASTKTNAKADPDNLDVDSYTDKKTGLTVIDITVKDELGYGVKGAVVQFFIRDADCLFPKSGTKPAVPPKKATPPSTTLPYHEVKSDAQGSALFLFPRKLKREEVIPVKVKISGIPGDGIEIEVSKAGAKKKKLSMFDRFFDSTLGWIKDAKMRHNTPGVQVQRNWMIRLMLNFLIGPMLLLGGLFRRLRANRIAHFFTRRVTSLRGLKFRTAPAGNRVKRSWLIRLPLTIISIPLYILRFIIITVLRINSNNGRARLGWLAVPVVFFYCCFIGIGDVSFDINGVHWQKYWWVGWFFGTFFAMPLYTIVAMREELGDLWIACTHRWRHKHSGSTHDSQFERLLEYGSQLKSMGAFRRPAAVVADASGAAVIAAPGKKVGFGSMFLSDMSAEFAWDFLSKAFVKIIKG